MKKEDKEKKKAEVFIITKTLRIDSQLIDDIKVAIESKKTSETNYLNDAGSENSIKYRSFSEFFRSAIAEYVEGNLVIDLERITKPSSKKETGLRFDKTGLAWYEGLPSGVKTSYLERILEKYATLKLGLYKKKSDANVYDN